MTSRPRLPTLTLLAMLVSGCGADDSSAPPGPPPPPPSPTSAVNVNDNFFSPASAGVGGQATVTWTWQGNNQHNVTFQDGQGSSNTKTAGSHQRTFSGAGTFRYRCTIHSTSFDNGMVGSVVVQ